MNKEYADIAKSVRKLLSDYLGIEPEDVEDDYSLTEDLHMKPTDLTDFCDILSKNSFEVNSLDFNEIETFSELIDELSQQQ